MPKIIGLPPNTEGLQEADLVPIRNMSNSTTEKATFTQIKELFQSIAGWITTAMIGDAQVSAEKLKATIAAKAYRSSAFNLTTSEVKLSLNAEVFDTGSDFDTTNGRFVAPVTGYYRVSASVGVTSVGSGNRFGCQIYVNGSRYAAATNYGATAGGTPTAAVSDLVYLTAGQYIELYIEASTTITGVAAADKTFLSINFVGAV